MVELFFGVVLGISEFLWYFKGLHRLASLTGVHLLLFHEELQILSQSKVFYSGFNLSGDQLFSEVPELIFSFSIYRSPRTSFFPRPWTRTTCSSKVISFPTVQWRYKHSKEVQGGGIHEPFLFGPDAVCFDFLWDVGLFLITNISSVLGRVVKAQEAAFGLSRSSYGPTTLRSLLLSSAVLLFGWALSGLCIWSWAEGSGYL